jgi:small-conductance mechanosensitive channel
MTGMKILKKLLFTLVHSCQALPSQEVPRACLEHFVRACREGAFHEAANALNFNLMPAAQQQEVAEARARELFYILSKSVRIDWDLLSDRPDGQINQGITAQQSITGQPLRSINFGSLDLNGQTLPLRIQRVRVEEQSPVWVVSANTVENIIPLYKAYGPSPLAQRIPVWAKTEIIGIAWWKIIGLVVLITLCLLIARLSQYLINKAVKRSEQPWVNELGEKMGQPVALAISALLFYGGMKQVLSISGTWSPYLYAFLLIIVIGSVTWLLMRSIDYLMDRVAERKVGDITNEENLESKRYLTLISVVRKVITFLIIILGIGAVVSQFPSLQNLGLSLFASAGIATVILGIAAQSTLGNIIAGLQIAITKPVRIGDWVLFEGEYGAVEDIRFTYLVINTWDKRRVVVPLRYFITHPFENWTMYDAHLLKPIVLHADYEIDVNLVRISLPSYCALPTPMMKHCPLRCRW